MNKDIAKIIQQELKKHHDAKKAKWLENYIKHDIKSRGVGIPQIRSIVQNVYSYYNKKFETEWKNKDKEFWRSFPHI